jgi:competence protein ComEC
VRTVSSYLRSFSFAGLPGAIVTAASVLLLALVVLQTPVLPPRWLLQVVLGVAAVLAVCFLLLQRWPVVLSTKHGAPLSRALIRLRLRLRPGLPLRLQLLLQPEGRFGRGLLLLLLLLFAASVTLLPASHWESALLPDDCERLPVMLSGVVRGLPRRLDMDALRAAYKTSGQRETALYRFELTVRQLEPSHCRGPERVRLYYRPDSLSSASAVGLLLLPGAGLQLQARLRRPWGLVNPHAAQGERQYLLAGVHAVGSVTSAGLLPAPRSEGWSAHIDHLRADLSHWLRLRQGNEIGGLLAALAVGDRRFIADEGWQRLRVYGLTHAFVISGLHITLIALPGWLLGRLILRAWLLIPARTIRPSGLPALLALCFAGLYACLAGLSLPTLRALVTLVLGLLPLLGGRPLDRTRLLAACALLLWLLDPLSVLGPSFWLSLGAVALLLWFSHWTSEEGGLTLLVRTQTLMLVGMLPLSLFWFGQGSTVGGVLNLVAVPLLTVLVIPWLLLSLLLSSIADGLATALLAVPAGVVETLWLAMGHWESRLGELALLSSPTDIIGLVCGLLAAAVLAMVAFPGRVALALTLAAPLLLRSGFGHSDDLRITVFDVGQGTAVLLRQGAASLVYDTGGGPPGGRPIAERAVLPLLRAERVAALDHLIVSHADRDHNAGESRVRETSRPAIVWRSGNDSDDEPSGYPDSRSTKEQMCRLGKTLRFGSGTQLRFLSLQLPGDSDNDGSCVLLISAFGQRFLLPGDIEHARERDLLAYWGSELSASVLLAAHHGSATSTGYTWLKTVNPQLVIVTAARANQFGHPSAKVVARVQGQGAALLNTAADGAIELRVRTSGKLSCRRLRHKWQPFWRAGDANRDCMPPVAR